MGAALDGSPCGEEYLIVIRSGEGMERCEDKSYLLAALNLENIRKSQRLLVYNVKYSNANARRFPQPPLL